MVAERDLPPGVLPVEPVDGYALLDCGAGEKLEQVGGVRLRRPDPQAMWRPTLPASDWDSAELVFVRENDRGGRWEPGRGTRRAVPESWELSHRGARFILRPTPFKHIGLFPEQAGNWSWVGQRVEELRAHEPRPALLNLFAYTGAATVLASRAGAFVTHVDASKPALRWARENAQRSALADDAVRWIEDDAARFVAREARRGRRYRGILLDPPPYGRGPQGELWEFEKDVAGLLEACRGLLAPGPAFVVLSCYAVGTSPLAFRNLLGEFGAGEIEAGELAIAQQGGERLLPAGLCGRWRRGP